MSIRPFEVDVPPSEVARMKRKLQDTRVPREPIVPGAGTDYGPPVDWIHRLYSRLLNLDWPPLQDHLNRHAHFIASIADPESQSTTLDIHFTHTTSSRQGAIPLLLVHGWPGSFFEFDRVIEPFTSPPSEKDPAFHVVVASLPGFTFSSPPPRRGWSTKDTARIFHKLMTDASLLGYGTYVVQAGDWGMFVARELGANPAYANHCRGVHLNFCPTPLPEHLKPSDLTEREKQVEARCQDWLDNHLGYAVLMRSRPQTLAPILQDNPMGILTWVGEKYLELSHPRVHNDPAWDEAIVTQAALYYFSNCVAPSGLIYFENIKHAGFGEYVIRDDNQIRVPFGYTSFLYDSRPGTRRGVERSGNLVFYSEYDHGGHFAALECPDVLVSDCRKFFGEWYRSR